MSLVVSKPQLISPVTPEDLGQLQIHLPVLKVISYRGPGESGGVSKSLEPVVKQLGTKIHWVALSGLPDDSNQSSGFSYYRPQVSSRLIEGHSQVSHEYLWPLFHGMPERALFDADNWRSFRCLSEAIASESLAIASQSYPSLLWLHDYQMALVAPLVAMEAGVIPCHFWHVPWPKLEIMARSPVGAELTESLLMNRLVGFHTAEYAQNFLAAVEELVPGSQVDRLSQKIRYRGHTSEVEVMPLGIDFAYWQRLAKAGKASANALPKKHKLASQLVLGVDRLDYSKGVLEKLNGLELFLKSYPDYHRRFHYVQLAQPAQSRAEAFQEYAAAVKDKVRSINSDFHINGWEPIVWIEGYFSQEQLAAWYQAADVLTVTPVCDGLNLIAKEYVACRQDDQGVLVLSRQAGCAAELMSGSLLVEALDPGEIAHAIAEGLSMAWPEKSRRMLALRHAVSWNQLHDWACGFLRQAIVSGIRVTT